MNVETQCHVFGVYSYNATLLIIDRKKLKSFVKDLRSKKKCFFPVIANIFDQSSDIGFIFGMYGLMIEETSNNNDCENINALYLFCLSLFFFLFYRVTSAIMVYNGTKNSRYAIGQFLFEFMLYRSIYVNYQLKCKEPSSGQQWIQNMESMLEAFPQLILQTYYTVQVGGGTVEWFVMISIGFSMLSMVNKAVSEDKALFMKEMDYKTNTLAFNWKDAEWTLKRFPCMNRLYLIRALFRICDISHRVLIVVIVWYEFGGITLFIFFVIEFLILFAIIYKTKEFSCAYFVFCCEV